MPLLPTNETEEKDTKSTTKSENLRDFHLKLKLLPSNDIDETKLEFSRSKNIQFILMIILFVILLYFLHLNRQGISIFSLL